MVKLIIKHIAKLAMLLVAISVICFYLVSISPIDPLSTNVGQSALGSLSSEQIEKLNEYYGNYNFSAQSYLNWGKDFIKGDMGVSLTHRQPVFNIIGDKLKNSLVLLIFAWIISGILGVALGIIAGVKEGTKIDKIIKGYTLITSSTPTFWLAMVMLTIFSVWLKMAPIGFSVPIGTLWEDVTFWDLLKHGLLPGITLSIIGISGVILHTREKVIDVMSSDYVLLAKARGESLFSIIKNHLLRNILLPAITIQFASISEIIGGSVLVEQVFSYPGLGQAAINAGLKGDIPLLLGITLITASIVFLGNFIANILYGIIDPRIRRNLYEA